MQQHADGKRVCSKLPDVLRWTQGRIRRQQLWYSPVQYLNVSHRAGTAVTISYTNGDPVRYALLSVNGGPGTPLTFPSTGSFQTVGSIQTTVVLNTGNNTLEFSNPIVGSWAPDFDQIQFNCPTSYLGNISTRSFVQTGDDVMIGGFIVRRDSLKEGDSTCDWP